MISVRLRNFIYVFLAFLVLLDLVLSTIAMFFPDTWFMTFHGVAYDSLDVEHLLTRTGALWAAFTLLQFIALIRWRRNPWWLILIAGVRWTELFSDWTYIYVANTITPLGRAMLFIAPPGNLAFGLFLIWAYKKIIRCGGA